MKKHHLTRLCSILLLAALLVSLTVPLASAYSDVTRSAFPDYFDAINYVTDNGLMNGTSSTQFEPNSFVSRAMVVTTLYRMAGSPSSSTSVSFTDVSSTDWFYAAVRWSVQYGIRSINFGVEKKSRTILCITVSGTPNIVEEGNTLSG